MVQDKVQEAADAAAFALPARNWLLAHLDLATATSALAAPFDLGSRAQMKKALEAILVALNEVAACHGEAPSMFDFEGGGVGGADELVDLLTKGMSAHQANS